MNNPDNVFDHHDEDPQGEELDALYEAQKDREIMDMIERRLNKNNNNKKERNKKNERDT